MENEENPEDFAQILARLKSEYDVSDSEIARRTGISVSSVNTWVHRKRTPRIEAIRTLAKTFPKFTEKELSDAAGRATPGPLSPDRTARLLSYFEQLTEEQQELQEIQIKAVVDSNHRGRS
ncbi:helix-turn-helix domain-containing protein [Streptomyces sp. NPDC058405]|uniref:helix-turn-helix domain-containing protein n=1 Tax=Streptomyces sp. NPDC058405 TaxID=3346482 RepID=UPI00364E45C0